MSSEEQAQWLTQKLLDPKFMLNVDGLLDGLIALCNDCNYPVIKKTYQNISTFLDRNEKLIKLLSQYRISNLNFRLIKVIGRGAFGEVQLVRNVKNNKVYAMKLLDKEKMIRRSDAAFFWEERDIMAYSESDWIVKMHYAFQDQKNLYMVMEFMPGGDLVNLMANHDIPENWAQFYLAELVLALNTIHLMGYIHRDVKPDNMLISASGHIKLADFGTCIKMNTDGLARCSTAVGTPDYICPEVLRMQGNEGVYGRELDWWAVGVTLYELIIGETPFYSDSLANTYSRIMDHGKHLKFPDDVSISDNAKDLIRKLLSEPNARLGRKGVAAIKSHPFFQNPNWNFENIQHATPPYIPQLASDDDTSHFDDVNAADTINVESFQVPKAFSGNELPFIGFTYSNDCGPLEIIRKQMEQQQQNGNSQLSNGVGINGYGETVKIAAENGKNQEEENNNHLNQIEELKCELEYSQKQIAELQQKLCEKENTSRKENESLKRDKDYLEIRANELRDQMDKIKQDNDKIKSEKKQVETVVDGLKAKVNELTGSKHEAEQLKEQLKLVEFQLQKHKEQLEHNHQHPPPHQQSNHHAPPKPSPEVETLKFEKRVLENKLKDMHEQLDAQRRVISDYQLRVEQEQKMAELFKTEIEARDRDNVEKEKRLQSIGHLEQQLEDMRQMVERERSSHRLLESTFLDLQREKSLLETEMRQMMQRHEEEYKMQTVQLQTARQRESELMAQVRQMEGEIGQFRKHSHGPLGLATVSGTSGLGSAVSTSSLVSNSTNSFPTPLHNHSLSTSGDFLENLTKEQLIQRCHREMKMKEQVVEKLVQLGNQKGITDDRTHSKKKKKREEEKRVKDLVEFQMEQERKKHTKEINTKEESIQMLNQLLYEEQTISANLRDELKRYRDEMGELPEAHLLRGVEPRRVPPRRLRGAGQQLLNNGDGCDVR